MAHVNMICWNNDRREEYSWEWAVKGVITGVSLKTCDFNKELNISFWKTAPPHTCLQPQPEQHSLTLNLTDKLTYT